MQKKLATTETPTVLVEEHKAELLASLKNSLVLTANTEIVEAYFDRIKEATASLSGIELQHDDAAKAPALSLHMIVHDIETVQKYIDIYDKLSSNTMFKLVVSKFF